MLKRVEPQSLAFHDKRDAAADVAQGVAQAGNEAWWNSNTMSYDWNDKTKAEPFSDAWFKDIDARFIHAARLFAHDRVGSHTVPFAKIIPFGKLKDCDVLEIGCGMGCHAELMARAGARLTAVDIADRSVEATTKRFALRGLSANIQQCDASKLPFPDASFDFVWSWGAIHHSEWTTRIIKEIARVLRPGGEARIMVYNINGAVAYRAMMQDWSRNFWRTGRTLDECLWKRVDGHMARFYSADVFKDILDAFFVDVTTQTFGQEGEAVMLPQPFRRWALRFMPESRVARKANARGQMLFATGYAHK